MGFVRHESYLRATNTPQHVERSYHSHGSTHCMTTTLSLLQLYAIVSFPKSSSNLFRGRYDAGSHSISSPFSCNRDLSSLTDLLGSIRTWGLPIFQSPVSKSRSHLSVWRVLSSSKIQVRKQGRRRTAVMALDWQCMKNRGGSSARPERAREASRSKCPKRCQHRLIWGPCVGRTHSTEELELPQNRQYLVRLAQPAYSFGPVLPTV